MSVRQASLPPIEAIFSNIFDTNAKKTAAAFFFLFVFFGFSFLFKDYLIGSPGMTTISGESRIQVKPETAKFTVSWYAIGYTPQEALAGEKEINSRIMAVLKTKGIKAEDIKMIYPQVAPLSGTADSISYQAVNVFEVKYNNLQDLDLLINDLYSNGAISISNITLSVSNEKELEDQVVAAAIEDGRNKAKKTAKAAKKRLGRLISLSTNASGEIAATISQPITEREDSGYSLPAETESISASLNQIEVIRQATLIYELK